MSKRILISLFVLLLSITAKAQEIEKCREIIKLTFQSVNKQSITDIEKYLSPNLEVAGQKGEIAKLVLKQLVSQLNDSIIEFKEQEVIKKDTTISFNYNLKYQKLGDKQASFTFNKENKITKLELLKIKVKRLDNSKQNVEFPSKNTISIPFKLYGKLIGVTVKVNGENLLFILDTGSPDLILNSKYFKDKDDEKNKILSSKSTKGVNGSINELNIIKINELDFYGIKYVNQDFLTMDLSHLEKNFKTKIGGLIGYETIKNYDILFDYKKKQITLIKPEYFEQYKEINKLTILSKKPIKLEKHIPIVDAIVNNNIYSFGIDCGAEANLIDQKLFTELKNGLRKIRKDTLFGADKKSVEVISAKTKKMYIAGKKYKNMKTVFNDISPFAKGYKVKINGLLGYEFLSKRKTLVSFKRKELHLIK